MSQGGLIWLLVSLHCVLALQVILMGYQVRTAFPLGLRLGT